jgi:hypothetical protein
MSGALSLDIDMRTGAWATRRLDSVDSKPGVKRRENGASCVLDELKPLGYLEGGGGGRGGRGSEGMTKGIPAANHDPAPVTRMRSTGLVQVFGGAGESES